jgi:hypothetical protein
VLSFVSLKKHDNVRANSSLNSASEELASVGIYLHNNSANGTLQTESSSLQKTASNHEQVLYFSTSLVAGLFHSKKRQNVLKSKSTQSLGLSHIGQARISI